MEMDLEEVQWHTFSFKLIFYLLKGRCGYPNTYVTRHSYCFRCEVGQSWVSSMHHWQVLHCVLHCWSSSAETPTAARVTCFASWFDWKAWPRREEKRGNRKPEDTNSAAPKSLQLAIIINFLNKCIQPLTFCECPWDILSFRIYYCFRAISVIETNNKIQ